MTCPHCVDADRFFGKLTARWELMLYRRGGARKTTRLLLELLQNRARAPFDLLDVGGGIGVIQHEVAASANRIHAVDASTAYLSVAREIAEERGYGDRATYLHGDFVEISEQLPRCAVVTLDRVLCCYPDLQALVRAAAGRSEHLLAVVYPRVDAWVRAGVAVLNCFQRLRRSAFRVFLHDPLRVRAFAEEGAFRLVETRRTVSWQVQLFERTAPGGSPRTASALAEPSRETDHDPLDPS